MKRDLGLKARSKPLLFAVLLSFCALGFTLLSPVRAQAAFDIAYSFDYSPFVSGATDSLHVVITELEPVRLRSVTVWFSWMPASTNLSPEDEATLDLQPGQQVPYSFTVAASPLHLVEYNFSIAVPENVAGHYYMTVDVIYQTFQGPAWGGIESETYVVPDMMVYGASPSAYGASSISYDPYDGRIYSGIALITLVGWYLPKKLRAKAKG